MREPHFYSRQRFFAGGIRSLLVMSLLKNMCLRKLTAMSLRTPPFQFLSSWPHPRSSAPHPSNRTPPSPTVTTNCQNNTAHGTPLQYSCLENPMDGGPWWAAVRGVAQSRTRLSNFTFIFHFHALEKEMATHSSVLAWRIPGTGKPGGLLSMGLHRVRHD